jgi:putative tryptophan/tyrosine transport system substrate-binding protein
MQFDRLKRREFITLLGGAAVAKPFAAWAEGSDRVPMVAVEMALGKDDQGGQRLAAAFEQSLRQLGWGQNVRIEYRWGATNAERAQTEAAELAKLNPAVIVAHATIVARAFFHLSTKIPIVFVNVSDP